MFSFQGSNHPKPAILCSFLLGGFIVLPFFNFLMKDSNNETFKIFF